MRQEEQRLAARAVPAQTGMHGAATRLRLADLRLDAQGRALEALRKGAQGMAQSMQQQPGMGPGPGQPGRGQQQRAGQDTDPLGRPLRGRDYGDDVTVKVPGEIDVQRARRILEELRRRFADPREWADAGFRDVFAAPGLKLAEWPDNAAPVLPVPDWRLQIEPLDTDARQITVHALTPHGVALLKP